MSTLEKMDSKENGKAYVRERSSSEVRPDDNYDAVFGERLEGHTDYKSVGWMQATILMLKTIIALGVLAMPTVLSVTGGVPGSLIILVVGLLTTWSGHVVGSFKRNHPEVYAMDGVGYVLAGNIGREFYSIAYPTFMIFLTGSGFVAISIAFNAVSQHATCTVVWVAIAMIGTFALASIQTLNRVSILGWIGFVSVMSAIMIISIAVGIQDRPVAAPQTGPWDKNIGVVNSQTSLIDAMGAVSIVVFSYSGTPAFLNIIGEMRRPQDYNKALYITQAVVTATYLSIGIVVYYFAGQYLTSPALGSAGEVTKRIAYGVALPGLFASVTIYTHVGAKMVFVRLLRGTEHLTSHTKTHWAVWYGTVFSCVMISFILAESIPVFGQIVNLIGATLGTLMCFTTMGLMSLYDQRAKPRDTLLKKGNFVLAIFMIVAGTFIMITGTWSAVVAIKNSTLSKPFSCADNSRTA